MADYKYILVDEPRPLIRRITLNRPEKRNALSNKLRGELFDALETADRDEEVRVIVLRGAGPCFSAGYDLASNPSKNQPFHTAGGAGNWPRHVTDGAFRIWDLAKPVIAQIHGYCLAGGSELMAACDLAYIAEDAQVGYPPVRLMSPPDNQFHAWFAGMRNAMELMLTGDSVDGREAVRIGLANRCYPADELDEAVLERAERVAKVPTDIQQINKRSIHRGMEIMGMRAAIRAGTELQTLGIQTQSARDYLKELSQGVTEALTKRDEKFGDYRTQKKS